MILRRRTEILKVNCPHCGKVTELVMRFTVFLWVFYFKDNEDDPLREAPCEHCKKVVMFRLG